MTSPAICPCCEWPAQLSAGRCAICGQALKTGVRSSELVAPESVNQTTVLVERWLIHALVISALILGRQVFPSWLVFLQHVATGLYLAAVSLWSLKSLGVPGLKVSELGLPWEAGIFGMLAVAVLAGIASIGQNSSTTSLAGSPTVAGGQTKSHEDPELVRLRQQGLQTQAYLRQHQQLLRDLEQRKLPPQEVLQQLSSLADRLELLPSQGVDVQAVEHVFDVAKVLRLLHGYVQRSQDPGYYLEAFLRGLGGDPFGAALEFDQAGQVLGNEIKRVDANERRLKAVLAARYNVSFE